MQEQKVATQHPFNIYFFLTSQYFSDLKLIDNLLNLDVANLTGITYNTICNPPPSPVLLIEMQEILYTTELLHLRNVMQHGNLIFTLYTADFIKKVLGVYTHSMTTIFLSVSARSLQFQTF